MRRRQRSAGLNIATGAMAIIHRGKRPNSIASRSTPILLSKRSGYMPVGIQRDETRPVAETIERSLGLGRWVHMRRLWTEFQYRHRQDVGPLWSMRKLPGNAVQHLPVFDPLGN